jgi:nitroreductase
MNVIEAIYARRAVRDFGDEDLSSEAVRLLVDAAVQAPSAMNRQPWSFVVIRSTEVLRRISERAKTYLVETVEPESPLSEHVPRLSDPAFDIFYGARAMILICARSDEPQALEDCCLAAQNVMLAAHAMRWGTCWIGFARPWLSLASSKAELGIPADLVPVAPIIVGRPRTDPPSPGRKRPEILWIGKQP